MASCKRESRLTSLGHAPAMGPHLACEWPGRQRANLRVEVSAQPYLVVCADPGAQSQRSIGAQCGAEVSVCRRASWCPSPSIHIHPLVTLLLARNV